MENAPMLNFYVKFFRIVTMEMVILVRLILEMFLREKLYMETLFMLWHFPRLIRFRVAARTSVHENGRVSPFIYIMQ